MREQIPNPTVWARIAAQLAAAGGGYAVPVVFVSRARGRA